MEELLKILSNDLLLEYYANAYVTYLEACGHNKAEKNYEKMHYYHAEIVDRSMSIPSHGALEKNGIFNGDGTY